MSRTKRRNSRTKKLGTRSRRIRSRRIRGGLLIKGGCGTCNMKGGRKGIMKGMKGGFVKQDLVNFGRDFAFGASAAYRGLLGLTPPTNPSPLVQPIKIR
jgi:hypothetical protein